MVIKVKIKEQLKAYEPDNEQEERDKEIMLQLLEKEPNIFIRENETAHFTASAWLTNREHTKVLFVYHNIYDSWAWTGGHADGETDLLKVAMKEAMEETGITTIWPVKEEIYSIEILTVDGHRKRGKYVPSHLHLNVTYLLETEESESLRIKPDENQGVKWFPLEKVIEVSSEPWMAEWIYPKLRAKLVRR